MGFGEMLVAAKEIYELIKIIKEIITELDIDQKDVENALKKLKEFCEGPLVEAVENVVNKLMEHCSELIRDFMDLFDGMDRDVKEIEKTDKEGAELLKSALYM